MESVQPDPRRMSGHMAPHWIPRLAVRESVELTYWPLHTETSVVQCLRCRHTANDGVESCAGFMQPFPIRPKQSLDLRLLSASLILPYSQRRTGQARSQAGILGPTSPAELN